MKRRFIVLVVVIAGLESILSAAEPVESEMAPLLRKVASRDADTRKDGVKELLGIREAVSEELKAIVAEGNNGNVQPFSKASALWLMGELGLVQCRDALEREKDWDFKLPPGPRGMGSYRMREGFMSGYTARGALGRAAFSDKVTLVQEREKADLSRYPLLSKAFQDIRSPDENVMHKGSDVVLAWRRAVFGRVSDILSANRFNNVPNEITVTAAFLLGEFRQFSSADLLRNISIKDTAGVCSTYPEVLAVQTDYDAYPCAVALAKIAGRVTMGECLEAIISNETADDGRQLIARVIASIDKDAAIREYQALQNCLQSPEGRAEYGNESDAYLARLRTVEAVIMQ